MDEKTIERLGGLTEQIYQKIEDLQQEEYDRQLKEYLKKVEQPMQEVINLYDIEKKGAILKEQRRRFQVLYENYHGQKNLLEQSISESAPDRYIERQLAKIQSFALGFQQTLKEYADNIWKFLEEYDAISKRIEDQYHSVYNRYMQKRQEISREDFLRQAGKEFTELQTYCVVSGYELQPYDVADLEENSLNYESLDSMAEHCYMLRDRSIENVFAAVEDAEKIQLQLGIFYEAMCAKKLGEITIRDIL